MNREIKFRIFVKESKEMIYGRRAMSIKAFTPNYAYLDNEVEVMQYTGIKDRNGNDIYEGDILGYGYVVTYVDDSDGANRGMNVGFYEQRDNFESWIQLEVGAGYEVLGNIYENPELLAK